MARASYAALLVAGTREFRYEWKALLGIAGDNVTSWIVGNEKRFNLRSLVFEIKDD